MNMLISVSAVRAMDYQFMRIRTVSLSVGATDGDDNVWYLGTIIK